MTVLVVGIVDGFLQRGPRLVLFGAVVQAPSLGLARVGRERESGHSHVRPTTDVRAIPHAYFTYEQSGHPRSEQQSRRPRASKASPLFCAMRKASMVGFISNLAPLLNYLRRRSPGPPFPPDHRQTGERGAITRSSSIAN